MAKSGSYDFNMTIAEIATAMYRKLGVVGVGQSLSAFQMTNGIEVVNARIKMYPALMKKIWGVSRVIQSIQTPSIWVDDNDATKNWEATEAHTTSATNRPTSGAEYYALYKKTATTGSAWSTGQSAVSKSQYTVDNNVVHITNVKLVKADIENSMEPLAREEYYSLSLKNTEGDSSQYYFEKKNSETNSYLYVFPAPDATTYNIVYDAHRYPQDFDTQSDTPDFPPEWLQVLIYGGALDLYPEYPSVPVNKYKIIKELFTDSLNNALSLDEERGDAQITPFIKE